MRKPLDVLQMLKINIVGGRSAAKCSTAERKGRNEPGRDAADALRAGRIDENPACPHEQPEPV